MTRANVKEKKLKDKDLLKLLKKNGWRVERIRFVSLVSCDLNRYEENKAVKKTLTIPSWLNDRAMALGINFSKTLQDALLLKIQK